VRWKSVEAHELNKHGVGAAGGVRQSGRTSRKKGCRHLPEERVLRKGEWVSWQKMELSTLRQEKVGRSPVEEIV
jgi:hypothetical protein